MEYEGYKAIVTFDYASKLLKGEVINIQGIPPFFGSSVQELEAEFKERVEEHLVMCLKDGNRRAKPFNGRVVLPVPYGLHEEIYIMAKRRGLKMGKLLLGFVKDALERQKKEEDEANAPTD